MTDDLDVLVGYTIEEIEKEAKHGEAQADQITIRLRKNQDTKTLILESWDDEYYQSGIRHQIK